MCNGPDNTIFMKILYFLGYIGWDWISVVCQDVPSVSVFVAADLIFPEDIENNINTEKAKKDLQMEKCFGSWRSRPGVLKRNWLEVLDFI